ncbi:lytic transglycosylase domain-containing protein [Candidatus Fermentibacteria bacterium]|nr:lytic transglycosylase domain-containing protein [Candidatus Fermentibacteria bacterium]
MLRLMLLLVPAVAAVSTASEAELHLADSLALRGRFEEARSILLEVLDGSRARSEEALYRLLGLYHGCGRELEFVSLLDSIERASGRRLAGWRVSALDLAGLDDSAFESAPPEDVLLRLYLAAFDESRLPAGTVVPVPSDAAGRYVRLMAAGPGELRPDQFKAGAIDARLFPSLLEVLSRELMATARSGGAWWDAALDSLEASCGAASVAALRLARMEARGLIDEGFCAWCLDSVPTAAGEAARLLLKYEPSSWGSSWRVLDALVAAGLSREAEWMVSRSADPLFRSGARLALLRSSGRASELLDSCASLRAASPESLAARAALFQARALRDLGRNSEAWAAYADFSMSHPGHPKAAEAGSLAGRYYDSEHMWAEAAAAYLASLAARGKPESDETCYWRGGFCLFMSGQARRADSLWAAGCAEWPGGWLEDEMLYWRARYAAACGRTADSSDLLDSVASAHPWEFYGILGAARMSRSPRSDYPVGWIDLESPGCLSAALELAGSGRAGMAVEMLQSDMLPDPGGRAAALSLLGEHRACILLLTRLDGRLRTAGTGRLPDSLVPYYFPAPYLDLAARAAESLLVEPWMLTGIMREESSFDRRVVSGAGARGLIQLMPGTAADVARWHGLPRLECGDFFDPEKSVRYGSLYIDRQCRNFGGEPALFLAAYNAGPGNASRWRDGCSYSPRDPEMFIEQITFRETRNYAKLVMRSAWIYEGYFR